MRFTAVVRRSVSRTSARTAALAILLAATAAGCGGGGSAMCTENSYYALVSDFQGFESWPSETYVNPTAEGLTHVAGVRTVYLNHAAPAGATVFPLGTIIVKRTLTDHKIFARVKRGGCFNSQGAKGWEWLELKDSATPGAFSIVWRGSFPPAGEAYGGDPNGGCNMCHDVPTNDYVLAPGLSLAGFAADGGTEAGAPSDAGAATDAGVDGDAASGALSDATIDAGSDDADHE
jgi:hypothetical protein